MTSQTLCSWGTHAGSCRRAQLSRALVRIQRPAPARRHAGVRTYALFGGNKGDGQGGGGGNPFAALGNMGNMMESEAAKAQQELAEAEFDGYSSDETVRVVMSGNQEPKSVDITEEAIAGGAEALSALVTEAMKDAHSKSVDGMKTKMKDMASKLGLGGGANPFGSFGG